MHLCIVGTGAAGWMAANYFDVKDNVTKITIIGSPEILPIGVGESNTLALNSFHSTIKSSLHDFVVESDAAVKYGVFYKNWHSEDFLHNFKCDIPWRYLSFHLRSYLMSLSRRDEKIKFHDLYAKDLFSIVKNNDIYLEVEEYPVSWHFDAAKYIRYLCNRMISKSTKLEIINDTVLGCVFKNKEIESVKLASGCHIIADYFIFATGSSKFMSKELNVEYEDLSDVLLTNKAYVFPLKYSDKKSQFHPYTVAKTMKYGWRWITPTYSRIGTGYVFSDNHVDSDQALKEFLEDIGDLSLEPRLVSFEPKFSKKTFNVNHCTIGMANGFLEPLDAPGLSITIDVLSRLNSLFMQKYYFGDTQAYQHCLTLQNNHINYTYKFWAAFILAQYKTCHRHDTDFWKDHQNVNWHFYNDLISRISNHYGQFIPDADMFYHTLSVKRFDWNFYEDLTSFQIPLINNEKTMNHLDFIESFRK